MKNLHSGEAVETAKQYGELLEERNALNEKEDYDGAFEVECTLRDKGAELAEYAEAVDYQSDATISLLSGYIKNVEVGDRVNDNTNLFNGASMVLSLLNSKWELKLLPQDHQQAKEAIAKWNKQ